MELESNSSKPKSGWRERMDGTADRLDSIMSPFENKLRSSEEVTSLLLTHNDWYQNERGGASKRMAARIVALFGCVCLVGIKLASVPFKAPAVFEEEFGDDIVRVKAWWLSITHRQPKQDEATNDKKRYRRSGLKRPPGNILLRICDFLFSKKTVMLTFRPLIADWRMEYYEALDSRRRAKARWICVRYYWYFAKAFGLSKLYTLIKEIVFALR